MESLPHSIINSSSFNESGMKETPILSEKEKKYQSKRKKTISRFLQDSTIAVYNPKQSFDEESSNKGEVAANTKTKGKKIGKRAASSIENNIEQQNKTKKRISIKDYLLKNNLLMEENPEEKFCICRLVL